MNKIAIAAVAASMLTVPAMAQAQQRTVVERGNRTVIIDRANGVQQRTVVNNRRGTVVRQNVRVANRPIVRRNVRVAQRPIVRQQVRYAQPVNQYRSWQRGQQFNRSFAPNYRQIDYRAYQQRGLYAPPRGQQWVQSGNDAVLIALASGLIGAVIGGAF